MSFLEEEKLSIPSREQRCHWEKWGFLALSGFYSGEEMARARQLLDELWEKRQHPNNPLVIDLYQGTK
jgi:hypothetical protein